MPHKNNSKQYESIKIQRDMTRIISIKKPYKYLILSSFILLFSFHLSIAQIDDLENILNGEMSDRTDFTVATFKSTRIINGHSIERMQKRELDLRISHRFGSVQNGFYDFFGMDQANSLISLEYGINNRLMVGIGRTTYQKTYTAFTKFSLLRQCSGKRNFPISVTYCAISSANTLHWDDTLRTNYFSSRFSYINQLLIARKFSERFSLQLSPTFLHRNLVETANDANDIMILGVGGRFKLTNRLALTAEYFYIFNSSENTNHYIEPLSFGIDIETGSHVFQLMFSNTPAINERGFLTETQGKWKNGDIHFGFNITRVFSFRQREKK